MVNEARENHRRLLEILLDGRFVEIQVGVEAGASWTATTPSVVFDDTTQVGQNSGPRHYDVAPDGQRFLVLRDAPAPEAAASELIVVQHFDELLRRLVPDP